MKKSNFVALILGTVGMCMIMLFGKMVLGIVIGIVALLMLIPLIKGLK